MNNMSDVKRNMNVQNGAKNSQAPHPEHFVDKRLAQTEEHDAPEPLHPSDLQPVNKMGAANGSGFQTEAQREIRPVQGKDQQKRKLMEELLTLKQEVKHLRKAADTNEDSVERKTGDKPQDRDIVLKRFKEQI